MTHRCEPRPAIDWTIDVEKHIDENPDGMQLEDIAAVFGVSKQAVDQIITTAAAKLRHAHHVSGLREYLLDAYRRAPHPWQGAWDVESDGGGVSQVHIYHGRTVPLSAAAAEPSELTARIDAAIGRLEVAADRALLAALSQVRLGES